MSSAKLKKYELSAVQGRRQIFDLNNKQQIIWAMATPTLTPVATRIPEVMFYFGRIYIHNQSKKKQRKKEYQ